jgi:hypothetical protein
MLRILHRSEDETGYTPSTSSAGTDESISTKGKTMQTQTYNGWTNYNTWLVALHIYNDHALDCEREKVLAQLDECSEGEAIDKVYWWLKALVGERLCSDSANGSLMGDLLQSALSEVNIFEIAKAWVVAHREV